MLHVRQRGRYWHVRGTVKAAGQARVVQEHSTGETRRGEAVAYAEKLASDIREELRGGKPAAVKRMSFADAGVRLLEARALTPRELGFLDALNEHFGDMLVSEIDAAAWTGFVRKALPGRKPATVDRYLSVLRSAFLAVRDEGVALPAISSPRTAPVRRRTRRVRWLTLPEADRLERAYTRWTRPVATLMRYQGLRTQEALQIDRRHVLLGEGPHGSLYVPESKNGLARTVALHPAARVAILPLLRRPRVSFLLPDEKRDFEPLFLSQRGRPFADTRGTGGNPMKKQHARACGFAGVRDFTVHDWRRHWACWCLKTGMDPWTLMKQGGWIDMKSVEHYVEAVARDLDHMGDALAKVA